MKIFDVIVVGAGPAGSSLATRLARDGMSVLLLDKARFPRDKVCGDFVSPKGLRYLMGLGCYAEIEALGCLPIERSVVYLDGERLSEGRLPALPDHPPHGHAIPRRVLDEIIFRCAGGAGAVTREGCEVKGFQVGTEAVTIEALEGGRRTRFASRLVVGADGANSTIARASGLEMSDPRHLLLSFRAYCHGLPLEHTILFFDEDFFPGFGWVFPITSTTANVGVGMVKEPAHRHGIGLRAFYRRLTAWLERRAKDLSVEIEITPTRGWPIKSYGGAERNYFERGLLIGEAACFVDPISGEGIPLAMESADFAHATIRECFESGHFGEATTGSYEQRWRTHWDPDLKVSDLVVSMIRNRHLVKLWMQSFRVMGMTALDDDDYALKTGGILAGLVPNREGFSPDIILKSLVHGPAFWLAAFGLGSRPGLREIALKGLELARWQNDAVSGMLADLEWSRSWVREIDAKQRALAPMLVGLGSRSVIGGERAA